jgi:hypothetical protein
MCRHAGVGLYTLKFYNQEAWRYVRIDDAILHTTAGTSTFYTVSHNMHAMHTTDYVVLPCGVCFGSVVGNVTYDS